mgnify:CR=1 FL=1
MEISLVFPHQLWEQHPALQTDRPVFLVEEFLFFRQYSFHKQKLVLHRASMKYYESLLNSSRYVVTYVHSTENHSDIRQLIPFLATAGIRIIHVADVVDDWLERRLVSAAHKNGIQIKWYSNPGFLLTKEDLKTLPEEIWRLLFASVEDPLHPWRTPVLGNAQRGPVLSCMRA